MLIMPIRRGTDRHRRHHNAYSHSFGNGKQAARDFGVIKSSYYQNWKAAVFATNNINPFRKALLPRGNSMVEVLSFAGNYGAVPHFRFWKTGSSRG